MPAKQIDILLIEDNPADIRLAQETLKDYRLQNTLHITRDGEAALQFLRRQGPYKDVQLPDMILMETSLPKLDGMEVLAEIRKDEQLREIPIVILTSSAMDEKILAEFDIKVDCYILKPLTVERYLDAVRCFPQMGLSIVKIAGAP